MNALGWNPARSGRSRSGYRCIGSGRSRVRLALSGLLLAEVGVREGARVPKRRPVPGIDLGDDLVGRAATRLCVPKELDIRRFVDYDLQFDKSFLDPLKNILNVVGWNTEKVNTLESFFA